MTRSGKTSRSGAAPGSAKRERDASDAGNPGGIKQARTDNKSMEEGREWQSQYLQGRTDTELHGLVCGHHLLGTPRVPFQAPFTCDGRIEVMSGTEGSGSIRLCEPQDYWGPKDKNHLNTAIFLIPFAHIEQVVILPNPWKPAPANKAYQVLIIPTGATGASSVNREYPQIASFSWPDKAADEELSEKVGDQADGETDTYLSILKKVLDEQLKAFEKALIDVSDYNTQGLLIGNSAVLLPPMNSRVKDKAKGFIRFLDTGVLFSSESQIVYLPFKSVGRAMVILAKDIKDADGGEAKVAAIRVLCNSSEPFYEQEEGGDSKTTLISFDHIDSSLLDQVKEYMKKHDVEMMLCQQKFYDYENNQPATGFMPLM